MKVKSGVYLFGLRPPMRKVLLVANQIYKDFGYRGVTITSTTDGVHSAGSLHPYGYAVDIRVREGYDWFTKKQRRLIVSMLRRALGADYDVLDEGNHIHIEWQKAVKLIEEGVLF